LNVTEPSFNLIKFFDNPLIDTATIDDSISTAIIPITFASTEDTATTDDEIISVNIFNIVPVNLEDTALVDDFITAQVTVGGILMQPDAGAPGMNLEIQFIGETYSSSTSVTTNSSDIVVGPSLAYDQNGDVVTSGGSVLKTIFFISPTASAQTVEVTVGTSTITHTFEIQIPTANSGDFTGQSTTITHPLGNDIGRNGTRTVGGTIVLESLIIPAGVTVNVTTTDIDPATPGNQGYLPAIILVKGDVNIVGTLTVAGQAGAHADWCLNGPGGHGGPGGGGRRR